MLSKNRSRSQEYVCRGRARPAVSTWLMFILMLFATSCDRRQLWDEWDELVPVDIKVDWRGSRWGLKHNTEA